MKKITFTICALMSLTLGACQQNLSQNKMNENDQNQTNEQVKELSPYVECKSIEEAIKLAGFEITVPKTTPNQWEQQLIQVIPGEMIEVIYSDGDHDISVRKAIGNGDTSGVHGDFSENSTIEVNKLSVSLRGENGIVNVATWENSEYTYAISSLGNGVELTQEMVIEMIKNIH